MHTQDESPGSQGGRRHQLMSLAPHLHPSLDPQWSGNQTKNSIVPQGHHHTENNRTLPKNTYFVRSRQTHTLRVMHRNHSSPIKKLKNTRSGICPTNGSRSTELSGSKAYMRSNCGVNVCNQPRSICVNTGTQHSREPSLQTPARAFRALDQSHYQSSAVLTCRRTPAMASRVL